MTGTRMQLLLALLVLGRSTAFFFQFNDKKPEAEVAVEAAAAVAPVESPAEDAVDATDTAAADPPPPFSCGAQLRLPANYPANWTLGAYDPESGADEVTLDDLQARGYAYAEYMKKTAGFGAQPALGAKFRNFRQTDLEMYWDDGTHPGMYSGKVLGMGRTATNTYAGHAFKFVHPDTQELVARIVMRQDTTMYLIEPEEGTAAGAAVAASAGYKEAVAEAAFYRDYYAKSGGVPWLSMQNRPPPVLNMWPAEAVGQVHTIVSPSGYWTGPGTQSDAPATLNLTVVSKAPEGPRVFLVENLLSEYECDHIIEQGLSVVRPSAVGTDGGFQSRTRTSENGWLRRSRSPELEAVHRRMADLLGMDEALVQSGANAEELQVVRYEPGQQYQPHHDFSDTGSVHQRFLTLLLHISPSEGGGATSFPKANGGRGLRVKPPKGSGVLFYSMLPDGNGDDLSLHAGEPVTAGRKWVCNLWVWDPKRNF